MQLSLPLDDQQAVAAVRERLLAEFGPQRDSLRPDPVSQLVAALISSRTLDDVSSAAFWRLRRRYPDWSGLAQASVAEVQAIIAPVSYAERKATQLPLALRMIAARASTLDLSFLADWDVEMAMPWLCALPGVGAKVAATVLNFSTLRMRVLAVDTHLLRVGARLGWLPPDTDYDPGHELFMHRLPDDWDGDDLYELHWLLKYLGQRLCVAGAPRCGACPLRDLCPAAARRACAS